VEGQELCHLFAFRDHVWVMNMHLEMSPAVSDEELWRLACEGDREAFSRIVERYQSLICSLAYSACGVLGTSEDIAQETFITAWLRLKELREPSKLRRWLCGIVRNIAANAVRRELHRGGEPESLDVVVGELSVEDNPASKAVTREEETLLWRTLGAMPENYREPLVLFYREERSIAEVALQLDLTEDTVKQRLSRGRAMLRDEMAALVESTLARTKPGAAFTVAVLVALPMVSATTASAALAAGAATNTSAGAAGKGILAKLGFGALIGPAIGLVGAYLGTRAAASSARSEPERKCILLYVGLIIGFCFAMSIGLVAVLSNAARPSASAAWIVLGVCTWAAVLVVGIILVCQRLSREIRRVRIETNTSDDAYAQVLAAEGKQLQLPKYFETKKHFLGLPLFAIAWGGTSSDRYRPRTVCGWLAVGDIAISPFVAIGGFAFGPVALGAVTVGVLSLSVFWGVALGVFAVGTLALGWWALGCAAAGVKCAAGLAAVARDYAVGIAANASETGSAAKEWLTHQWLADFNDVMLHQIHWWILFCLVVALLLRAWRVRQLGRLRARIALGAFSQSFNPPIYEFSQRPLPFSRRPAGHFPENVGGGLCPASTVGFFPFGVLQQKQQKGPLGLESQIRSFMDRQADLFGPAAASIVPKQPLILLSVLNCVRLVARVSIPLIRI
jgi:RNA polymerase sigma factor (sigma-70 family)